MKAKNRKRMEGFSLIELVIVVVIIGIIGAIAIPRMSRGASGAADSALVANLSVLRNALDLYAAEHGGIYPSAANVSSALTEYTDKSGTVSASPGGKAIYGPYLRAVPPLPVGAAKGNTGIAADATGTNVGWIYTQPAGPKSAQIEPNTTSSEVDAQGTAYSSY